MKLHVCNARMVFTRLTLRVLEKARSYVAIPVLTPRPVRRTLQYRYMLGTVAIPNAANSPPCGDYCRQCMRHFHSLGVAVVMSPPVEHYQSAYFQQLQNVSQITEYRLSSHCRTIKNVHDEHVAFSPPCWEDGEHR